LVRVSGGDWLLGQGVDTTHLGPEEAVEQILVDDLASSRW
jgi:hypothetical protein